MVYESTVNYSRFQIDAEPQKSNSRRTVIIFASILLFSLLLNCVFAMILAFRKDHCLHSIVPAALTADEKNQQLRQSRQELEAECFALNNGSTKTAFVLDSCLVLGIHATYDRSLAACNHLPNGRLMYMPTHYQAQTIHDTTASKWGAKIHWFFWVGLRKTEQNWSWALENGKTKSTNVSTTPWNKRLQELRKEKSNYDCGLYSWSSNSIEPRPCDDEWTGLCQYTVQ